MGTVEAGVLVGFERVNSVPENCYYCDQLTQRRENLAIGLRTVHGYRFFPYLFIGAGVGLDRYTGLFQTYLPLFTRFQSEFLKRKVTPFIAADIGYSFLLQEDIPQGYRKIDQKGGVYFSGSLGVRIYTKGRASVSFGAAYTIHQSHSSFAPEQIQDFFYSIQRTYQRLHLFAGVMF